MSFAARVRRRLLWAGLVTALLLLAAVGIVARTVGLLEPREA